MSEPLTTEEAELVKALGQLQDATFVIHVAPVQERMRQHLRRIEQRLALPAGALGTTHDLVGDPMVVVEVPRPSASEEIAPSAGSGQPSRNGHRRRRAAVK